MYCDTPGVISLIHHLLYAPKSIDQEYFRSVLHFVCLSSSFPVIYLPFTLAFWSLQGTCFMFDVQILRLKHFQMTTIFAAHSALYPRNYSGLIHVQRRSSSLLGFSSVGIKDLGSFFFSLAIKPAAVFTACLWQVYARIKIHQNCNTYKHFTIMLMFIACTLNKLCFSYKNLHAVIFCTYS